MENHKDLDNKLKALEITSQDLLSKNKYNIQEFSKLSKDLSSINNKLTQQNSTIKSTKDGLDKVNTDISQIKENIKQYEVDQRVLQSKVSTANDDYVKLRQIVEHLTGNKLVTRIRRDADDEKTSTIGDLAVLKDLIEFNDMKDNFNMQLLMNQMDFWKNLTITLINSVAKIDDRLIGNLLGNNAATEFIGNEEFLMYPRTTLYIVFFLSRIILQKKFLQKKFFT